MRTDDDIHAIQARNRNWAGFDWVTIFKLSKLDDQARTMALFINRFIKEISKRHVPISTWKWILVKLFTKIPIIERREEELFQSTPIKRHRAEIRKDDE